MSRRFTRMLHRFGLRLLPVERLLVLRLALTTVKLATPPLLLLTSVSLQRLALSARALSKALLLIKRFLETRSLLR